MSPTESASTMAWSKSRWLEYTGSPPGVTTGTKMGYFNGISGQGGPKLTARGNLFATLHNP